MSASDNEVKGTEEPETTEETGVSSVVDVKITLPNKTVVLIPSVYVAESLASFKQILMDYQECAAFTCYSLHLRELVNSDGTKAAADVACTEYTELSTLVEPTTVGCNFDLIPGEYNLKRVQDQLKRTNEIFTSPPTTKGAVAVEAASKKGADSAAPAGKADAKPAASADQAKALPKFEDVFKSAEFANFYGEVLYRTGKVEAVAKAGRVPSSKPIADAVKSVFPSGWNPPPPQRKVRGDLLYIEVVTANEGTIYITAVPR
jgi:protein TIF31